jgi:hypothetical protein
MRRESNRILSLGLRFDLRHDIGLARMEFGGKLQTKTWVTSSCSESELHKYAIKIHHRA